MKAEKIIEALHVYLTTLSLDPVERAAGVEYLLKALKEVIE